MYNEKLCAFLAIVLISNAINRANCQDNNSIASVASYAPCDLQISTNKITNLIFPFDIKNVNQGSNDVISWQVPGVDNILQVKAGKDRFKETNLTVITTNGSLYSFLVNYNDKPSNLTFHLAGNSDQQSSGDNDNLSCALKEAGRSNAEVISTSTTLLNNNKRILLGIHDRASGMNLKLLGIYSSNDVLYFHLECKNASDNNFELEDFHFYIREQYGNHRKTASGVEIKPMLVFGNQSVIRTGDRNTCIIAVPKFTIPYAKFCEISVKEKNGDRNLKLKIYNDLLVSSKAVPE